MQSSLLLSTITLALVIFLDVLIIRGDVKANRAKNEFKIMLDEYGIEPVHAHKKDAGYDIMTPFQKTVVAHGSVTIDTGVHILIPEGYVGVLKSKSGLNVKHGIISTGVIDAGYTGSIVVKLYNLSNEDYTFESGDKITQIVFFPVEYIDDGAHNKLKKVDCLDTTDRGNGGFGSSGR